MATVSSIADRRPLVGIPAGGTLLNSSASKPNRSSRKSFSSRQVCEWPWPINTRLLAKLPKRQQDQAKLMLRTIPYAPTRTEAKRLRTVFTRWCGDHSYEAASEALERDWDRMVTFYDFPKEHWGHLRTTNPVESPFAALRLRTDVAKRYKRVDRAIAVIWKMLMVAEQRFRRLKAPELTAAFSFSRPALT